jgi:hypothetical protein
MACVISSHLLSSTFCFTKAVAVSVDEGWWCGYFINTTLLISSLASEKEKVQ